MDFPAVNELIDELLFSMSRSSGPGGQNVNKVNSKVTLKWDLTQSRVLNDEQRLLLKEKLGNKITKEGVLMLTVQDARSQIQNKEEAINRLDALIKKAFTQQKVRKATKPSGSAKRKRLNTKKQLSDKKQWRRKL